MELKTKMKMKTKTKTKTKREIKFRGKRIATKKWMFGGYAECDDLTFIIDNGSSYPVIPSTIGQYTGLKDKNGTEIFEGDIVEITSYFTHPRDKVFARIKAEVVFRDGAFVAIHGSGAYHIANFLEDVEVFGNIHDNPDLMKGGEK